MISALLIIAQVKSFLDRWKNNELNVFLVRVRLENVNGSLACSHHGAYKYVFDVDMIGVFLCCLALPNTLWSQTGINQIFPDLKLPVFITLKSVSTSHLGKFHVEFRDCMSN